jgi:hypothetical protein
VLAGYRLAYEQIIAAGNRHDPPGTIPTGKRGVVRQTPARNLLTRLDRDREQILRFAHDFRVPLDNSLVERDIRVIKIHQKISGSWRTTAGADGFLALRAYISTHASSAATPRRAVPARAPHTMAAGHRLPLTRPSDDLNSHAHGGLSRSSALFASWRVAAFRRQPNSAQDPLGSVGAPKPSRACATTLSKAVPCSPRWRMRCR